MWKKLAAFCVSLVLSFAMATSVFAGDMYRFYNPNSGEHFYTGNYQEGCNLSLAGWKYEGIGWVAPDKSNVPVYRLYNPNNGDHHYTTSAAERDSIVKAGWKYEGIGWYSDEAKTVPMYRLFNPNAKTGAHNFTVSQPEYQSLTRIGWKPEGVAWYASAAGNAGSKVTFPEPAKKAAASAKTSSGSGSTSKGVSQQNTTTGTVYWTPGGKKYHSTSSCRTLRRSRTILSGPVSSAGGRTACKVCF